MKKSAEKIGQLLNYEKLSNINLLELPKIEKKHIPNYIQCPKFDKAKVKRDKAMERYTDKVDRLRDDLKQMKANIEDMKSAKSKLDPGSGFWLDTTDAQAVARHNDRIDQMRKMSDKIENAIEKHNDQIDKITEAQDEANAKLEELTLEALQVIDEDIETVISRCLGVAENFSSSEDAEELLAAIDICLIILRMYAMFDDLIEDNSLRKACKESIAKVNQIFSTLCTEESIQNYMVDIYRCNLDLVQKNARIAQQIDDVLDSVDQKQLDALSESIEVVLSEHFDTKFNYSNVIDPAEINKIVDEINKTIDLLKQNIEKAEALQAVETPAIELGRAGVKAEQQAKSLRASMDSNVGAVVAPLTQNHFAAQIIDEVVIDEFYQKDLRVAVTALRKHIVDTIGEATFEGVLQGGDDRFSLQKAHDAIDKANLTRLQVTLDKIPRHIEELKEKITNAESDIIKANEVPKKNADALSAELGTKYVMACIPLIGLFFAIGIRSRVKTFEAAFRGTNQLYKDLGKALIEKNKKMNLNVMIIGAIISFGSLIFFAVSGGPVAISVIVLVAYAISVLMLFLTEKQLQSFLGISADVKS